MKKPMCSQCGRPAHARGMCKACYMKWLRGPRCLCPHCGNRMHRTRVKNIHEPTDVELDALIAERYPTMPARKPVEH